MFNGSKMRELRRKKDLTQEQLGELIGVSKQMVGFYENGTEVPTEPRIQAIATALEVQEDILTSIMDSEKENALIEELKTINEFMKGEMTKLTDQMAKLTDQNSELIEQNLMLVKRVIGGDPNFPKDRPYKTLEIVKDDTEDETNVEELTDSRRPVRLVG